MAPLSKSEIPTLSVEQIFPLLWRHHLLLGKEYFYKIKGRGTLSRSHNNLSTTDDNPA
jgi:hypothetical protein